MNGLAVFVSFLSAMLMLSVASAVAQTAPATSLNGTILSANAGSFVLVNKNGEKATIPLKSDTAYIANKNDATAQDVVQPGMNVKVALDAQGKAGQVAAKGPATQLDPGQMQAFLGATDAEWTILKVKIDRIDALRREANGGGGSGGNKGNNGIGPAADPPSTRVRNLLKPLQIAFFTKESTVGDLKADLIALRETRAKVREELAAARKDLTGLITVRQEVLLVMMGVLE
jgi:hypothetical protein